MTYGIIKLNIRQNRYPDLYAYHNERKTPAFRHGDISDRMNAGRRVSNLEAKQYVTSQQTSEAVPSCRRESSSGCTQIKYSVI